MFGLTGAVEITCVWKLNGLAAAGAVGAPSAASSSPDMAEGGARKLLRGILRVVGSWNGVESVSWTTRLGGGVVVLVSGLGRRTIGGAGSIC